MELSTCIRIEISGPISKRDLIARLDSELTGEVITDLLEGSGNVDINLQKKGAKPPDPATAA